MGIRKPRFARRKIRPHIKSVAKLSDEWRPITELDGYDAESGLDGLGFCADCDVSHDIAAAINGLGVSILFATQAGVVDDTDVREWAVAESRLLIAGDKDYLDDDVRHPLSQCRGIIVFAENHDTKATLNLVRMMTCLVSDLIQNVPLEWWIGVRMKVAQHYCRLWKHNGGNLVAIELRPNNSGALFFKAS